MISKLRSACLGLAVSVMATASTWAADITVFAPTSLTNALEDVARAYVAEGGEALRFSFASSSTLARQIEAGAPGQVFVSADQRWMDYLELRDLIIPETRRDVLGNELVLIAPADSGQETDIVQEVVEITPSLDLAALLGPDGRLSVGDPDHVPAGIYAREALTTLGLWNAIEPRLARADNVRAALALVERGETPLGIVYATDARQSSRVRVVGTFPASAAPPITYPFAMLGGQASDRVKKAFDFLTGSKAAVIYERYGFTLK